MGFIRRIDAVHHMVHHLKEFGLRISSKVELQKVVDSEEDQEDDDKLVDAALKEMGKEIAAKKKEFKTERLDGTTNSKFTLKANVMEGEQGSNKKTKRDSVLQFVWDRVRNEMVMDALYEFVESQDVDTDCIEDEMEIFKEEKRCNLLDALRGDEELMETVKEYLRKQQILKQSFSTGLPLFYWKWYRNATEQDVRGNQYLSRMDLGGHSVQELSVDAVYDNLKGEVLATGL